MQTPIPYVLSVSIIGLYVYYVLKSPEKNDAKPLLFIMLSLLTLNHAEFIYIGMFVFFSHILSIFLKAEKPGNAVLEVGMITVITGISYTIINQLALYAIVGRIIKAFEVVIPRITVPTIAESGSLERPYPYLAALGYSLQVAVTLAISIFTMGIVLKKLRFSKISRTMSEISRFDIFFGALALANSLSFMVGFLWYAFRMRGPGNLLMYAYINAFIATPFLWIYLGKFLDTFPSLHRKGFMFLLALGIVSTISIIGVMFDPIAYPTPSNSYLIESGEYPKYHAIINITCPYPYNPVNLYISVPEIRSKVELYYSLYCNNLRESFTQGFAEDIVVNIGYPYILYSTT